MGAVTPPGPLTKDVFLEAVVTSSYAHCVDTLAATDPAWTQVSGSMCESSSTSSSSSGAGGSDPNEPVVVSGCALGAGAGASPAGIVLIAVAGAWLVQRVRRR
jgi:hypothetical protein